MTQINYCPHQTTLERVAGNLMGIPKFVLRLPFQTPLSQRLILISYMGRKTGESYTIPVSSVEKGDHLLIPGGGTWKTNVENGSPVQIRFLRKERSAIPEVIGNPDKVVELITFMMAANPAVSRFIGVPKQPNGHPNREKLEEAVRAGFAPVRLHLDQSGTRRKKIMSIKPKPPFGRRIQAHVMSMLNILCDRPCDYRSPLHSPNDSC